jgi:hypothetical protein
MTHIESEQPQISINLNIRREDLLRANLGEEEVALFSETDLEEIAQAVIAHFVSDAFWDELEFIATTMKTKCLSEDYRVE